MTVEELLKPRYRVSQDFPTSEFNVGSILYDDVVFSQEFKIKKYPNIFKKIEWWEFRNKNDMPEYVTPKLACWCVDRYFDKGVVYKYSEVPKYENSISFFIPSYSL